jgi:hypothetical protein
MKGHLTVPISADVVGNRRVGRCLQRAEEIRRRRCSNPHGATHADEPSASHRSRAPACLPSSSTECPVGPARHPLTLLLRCRTTALAGQTPSRTPASGRASRRKHRAGIAALCPRARACPFARPLGWALLSWAGRASLPPSLRPDHDSPSLPSSNTRLFRSRLDPSSKRHILA